MRHVQCSKLFSMNFKTHIRRSIPFGVFSHFYLDACSCKNKVHGNHDGVCGKSFLSASPEGNAVVASYFLYPISHVIPYSLEVTPARL